MSENRLIVDVDGTLCPVKEPGQDYGDLPVEEAMIEKLRYYRSMGYAIELFTARNMRTYGGDIAKINAHTAPVLLDWLRRHDVPFDGVRFGKPWPGPQGFYIDDRTVRPDEFVNLDQEAIQGLLKQTGARA